MTDWESQLFANYYQAVKEESERIGQSVQPRCSKCTSQYPLPEDSFDRNYLERINRKEFTPRWDYNFWSWSFSKANEAQLSPEEEKRRWNLENRLRLCQHCHNFSVCSYNKSEEQRFLE